MVLFKSNPHKTNTFPWKLHEMLELATDEGFEGIVSWLPDGKSFKVYDAKSFVLKVMPEFFHQSKYKSFQRQLNLWGFERLTKGPGKGGYARSEHFLRTNRSALCHVHRRKIKCLRASSSKKTSPTEIIPIIATANGDKDNGNNSVGEQQTTRTKSTSIGAASAVVGGHEQQTMKSSSSDASVVSHSTTSDASSVSSDSCDCDQSNGYDMISPTPISEDALPSHYMSEQRSIEDNNNNNNCPQTGDCLDFEGRRYFFVDEEELETAAAAAATITSSSTAVNHTTRLDNIALQLRRLQQQFPPEMSIFPTPIADVPMPEIQYW